MAKQNTKSKNGFTIIEVVLVLAIAGLIFLMVFIALPALQRSQRDTQRRDDMARLMSQLSQYQANNNGQVPTTVDEFNKKFIQKYLLAGEDTFADPSTGETYEAQGSIIDCSKSNDCVQKSGDGDNQDKTMGHVYVYSHATCNGEDPKPTQGARKIAITLKLEGAGVYCGNN